MSMKQVLERAWKHPFKTKSDFAREYADIIAMSASDGLLTTKVATGLYSRNWHITPEGLSLYYSLIGRDHK